MTTFTKERPASLLRGFLRLHLVFTVAALIPLLPLDGINPLLGLMASLGSYFFVVGLLSLVLIPFYLWKRVARWWFVMIHAACLSVILFFLYIPLHTFFFPTTPTELTSTDTSELSFLLVNVERGNRDAPAGIQAIISEHSPDLLIMLEATRTFASELGGFEDYPHTINFVEDSHFGLLILSKLPLAPHKEYFPLEKYLRAYNGGVILPQRELGLVVLHPPPPVGTQSWRLHTETFQALAELSHIREEDLLIAADLNATPHSYVYRDLLEKTYLRNAMADSGYGYARTWNTKNSFIRLPLDHFLYQGFIQVKGFRLLDSIGSDHLPLIMTLELPNN